MSFLDGLIGGAVGAEMATTVRDLLAKHGGLSGVVEQFRAQGLEGTIRSWISTGENQPITTDQLTRVIGADHLAQLAAKLGMTPDDLSAKLATTLPVIIDKMTPGGTIPAHA